MGFQNPFISNEGHLDVETVVRPGDAIVDGLCGDHEDHFGGV